MNLNDPFFQNEIVYHSDTHQYFNVEGEEYKSVTRALAGIKVPFDSARMSFVMAGKYAAEHGISEAQAQKEILASWEGKKDRSIDKGNYVHDSFERYTLNGKYDEEMTEAIQFLKKILLEHYRYYPETIIHSHKYKMAGRTDLALMRQKSKNPVLDFYDYKSNIEKGIQFDSIGRKDEPIKHYNRFLLPPFEYLEDCNYTIYSLQLSVYAFMAIDSNPDLRIGRLGIIFVDNDFKPSMIPVPFMYQEAKMICEMNITRKALPTMDTDLADGMKIKSMIGTDSNPFPETALNAFDPHNVQEDW